ncbi:hypothetical protein BU15DRAFT_68903 [Melanogaster broomeanus]|nr:hypothetical protein BU15DRAFT_68903 [Melanogaster broomeanus]
MDVNGEAAPPEGLAKKRRVKKINAPFTSLVTSLDPGVLEKFKMHRCMLLTSSSRTPRLNMSMTPVANPMTAMPPHAQPAEKTKLPAMPQEVEDSLYFKEGKDAMKSACVTKLDTLKAFGTPSSGISRSGRVLQHNHRAPDDA